MKSWRKFASSPIKIKIITRNPDFRAGFFLVWFILIFIFSSCIYPPAPYVLDSRSERDSYSEDDTGRRRSSRRSSRRSGRSSGGSSSINQTIDEINRLEDLEAEDYLDTVAYIYALHGACDSSTSITSHKSCAENCILNDNNLQNCLTLCNADHSCSVLTSLGSGTFMSETTVLTNYHVVEEVIEPYTKNRKHYYNIFTSVENYSKEEALLTAVTWHDENDDVALIEISPSLSVDVPDFGSLSSLRLLDELFTIGSPIGMKWTASLGHLTNKDPGDDTCRNCIIYSIPAFSGSSGGPVFNANGRLVAIHSFVVRSGNDNDRTQFRGGPHIDRIKELFDENRDTQNQRQEVDGEFEDYSAREQRGIADSVKDIVIQLSQE